MNTKRIIALSLCAVTLAVLSFCAITLAGLGPGTAAMSSPAQKPAAQKATPDPAYLDGVREFSARSASNILGGASENSNYSPVSLYMALSIAGSGAGGATQTEILNVLGAAGMSTAQLSEQTGRLLDLLEFKGETGSCELANSLWMSEKASFKPAFTSGAKKNFDAELFTVDFGKPAAGKQMGNWIKKNTHGLIAPQIKTVPGELLSIINTLYFYEEWAEEFPASGTQPDTFYLRGSDRSQIETDFMHITKHDSSYVDGDGYISASLWLKEGSKMLFVLPDKGVTPQSLLATPEKTAKLFACAADSKQADIKFSIPKFKFGSEYSLADSLRAMGMETSFTPAADFSGISKTPAYISSVIQQTRVAVDEKGVEAAAFTEVMMESGVMPQASSTLDFKLDRPFIYMIMRDDLPLFIGVVQNPTAE